jgi:hypothetical protein
MGYVRGLLTVDILHKKPLKSSRGNDTLIGMINLTQICFQ